MGCLTSAQRTKIQAEITKKEAQLDLLNDSYLSAIQNSEVEEYSFSSGEGQQRTKRRRLKELRDEIEWLESAISLLYRKLYGKSLVNLNLRRKNYGRHR